MLKALIFLKMAFGKQVDAGHCRSGGRSLLHPNESVWQRHVPSLWLLLHQKEQPNPTKPNMSSLNTDNYINKPICKTHTQKIEGEKSIFVKGHCKHG